MLSCPASNGRDLTMVVETRTTSSYLGSRMPRVDGPEKVTGQARYGDDLPLYGLLHARLVLGAYAHAKIKRIDASEALAQPGVLAVLTADDLSSILKSPPTPPPREPPAHAEPPFPAHPAPVVAPDPEPAP